MNFQKKPKQRKAIWWVAKHGREQPEPKQRRRVPQKSKRQRARDSEYNREVAAWKLEHPICAACERIRPGKKPRATEDNHHQRGKLGPLLMDKRFWIPVCRQDHTWIGDNKDQARDLGLLCARGEWNVPVPL